MDSVALDFKYIKIYWYSIFILIGVITAIILIIREAKKRNIDEDFILNVLFYGILSAIIGARLYYVLFNLDFYLANPSKILMIWNGGLAIHGGMLFGLITVIIMCKKYKVNIIKILDILVLGIIIGQAIGRWGNFFNSEAYGTVISLSALKSIGLPSFIINGMYIDGAYHHPTFLYESIWCLIGFIILMIIKNKIPQGRALGFYLTWYGIERLFVEALRIDSLMIGPIKVAQIVSIIFIIFGIYYLFIYKNKEEINE